MLPSKRTKIITFDVEPDLASVLDEPRQLRRLARSPQLECARSALRLDPQDQTSSSRGVDERNAEQSSKCRKSAGLRESTPLRTSDEITNEVKAHYAEKQQRGPSDQCDDRTLGEPAMRDASPHDLFAWDRDEREPHPPPRQFRGLSRSGATPLESRQSCLLSSSQHRSPRSDPVGRESGRTSQRESRVHAMIPRGQPSGKRRSQPRSRSRWSGTGGTTAPTTADPNHVPVIRGCVPAHDAHSDG